ncbi:TPA_asm: hypothetical protein CBHJFHIM_00009 [Methanobrevibacter gottschalkii virus vir075]|uniref:Uncharacterized protein n=1 Tax=Methanobrevibacter gottschalkii TaxID=190974 RepID=A0A1H7I423_9EURY|nr:hypothetical protein [Methanobrevibacter gottschalkii]SEK57286.1 hypothetical protein SAMN05216439_1143 [Methanobrevibacter gottschalkii]
MSKAYMTDFDKVMLNDGIKGNKCSWSMSDMDNVISAFDEKGYLVSVLSRLDSHAVMHDALIVNRYDIPIILEYLFQQRICVEVEAEGREEVSLIFVYNTPVEVLLDNIKKLLPHRSVML